MVKSTTIEDIIYFITLNVDCTKGHCMGMTKVLQLYKNFNLKHIPFIFIFFVSFLVIFISSFILLIFKSDIYYIIYILFVDISIVIILR